MHENAFVRHENVDMTLGTVLATMLSPNDLWIYVWSAWAAIQIDVLHCPSLSLAI